MVKFQQWTLGKVERHLRVQNAEFFNPKSFFQIGRILNRTEVNPAKLSITFQGT